MEKKLKKAKWTDDELNLLSELYPQHTSKRWKQIAMVFKERGFNRSEIECREKWINFLDPDLNRNDWEDSELQKLYEIHDQVGSKWCVIQKYIGRTQNKIKNRFYGTLRNYIRFLISHMDDNSRSYNYEIGKLSPNFLNDIYKAQNQFKFINNQVKNAIFQMGFKVDRTILAQRINSKTLLYEKLLKIVFKTFSNFKQKSRGRGFRKRKVEESEESLDESSESPAEQQEEIKREVAQNEEEEESQVVESLHQVVKEQAVEGAEYSYSPPKVPEMEQLFTPQSFFPFWSYPYTNFGFWPQ